MPFKKNNKIFYKLKDLAFEIIIGSIILCLLLFASKISFLLFHFLSEMITIVISFSIFLFVWNSKKLIKNNFFILLGMPYFFVGTFDIFHTIYFKGMNILNGDTANIATQFWIVSRLIESFTFLFAAVLLGGSIKHRNLILLVTFGVICFLLSLFVFNNFPVCYVEGFGLTVFKKNSEYLVCFVLIISIALLIQKRKYLDGKVLFCLIIAFIFQVIAEFIFTLYVSVHDFLIIVAHLIRNLSYFFIYKAIIQIGLFEPHRLLFKQLIDNELFLKEQKFKMELYFNTANVMIIVLGSDQNVRAINKKGCQLLGYAREEIIGKNWFDNFLPFGIKDNTKLVFNQLVSGQEDIVEYHENPILTKAKEIRLIEWHNTLVKDNNGRIIEILSSGQDITDRKKVEEILRRDKEVFQKMVDEKTIELLKAQDELNKSKSLSDLGMLAATVAHELRNPIAAISLAVYNIKRKVKDTSIDKNLENISRKIEESEQIINNLLFYSRTKIPKKVDVDLGYLLNESISAARNRVIKEHESAQCDLDIEGEIIIKADPVQLKEVFNNLLNNAYDSLSGDNGRIGILVRLVDQNNSVEIKFEDNGVGLTKDELERVFEPFYTTKSKGTGLGLTVCNQIISLHDGQISIESIKFKGTEIRIKLPLA